MNKITLIILIIIYISSILLLVISIAIYKINQKKMDKIIELYIEEGLYLPTGIIIQRFGRMRDQIHVVLFFYRLLTGKKMKINQPDSKYMHQESYNFIQNLPSSLTHWMKTCIIITYIGGALFFTSTIIVLHY
ncbi:MULTISPECIES: hypothetical protein [Photorhabdus]|uniref:hypothetical protein n=1 Tax=Photorhabdus TaxID=29487 RepID=UPI000D4A98DE|nr:hypothetical protein [Photorhabdus hainanensis]MBS9433964.1 hypothetical protein [Photorhabdus hainanensis]PQQ32886.1 hypothetical protein C6H69_12770 [Photorhabdus luminescens]PQQ38689.1 hypothetical protein C6H65_20665 [Photorhabdus luminescens]